LAAVAFGDPYTKKGQRNIGLVPQLLLQLRQPYLYALGFDPVECNPVYTRSAVVGSTVPVRLPEYISTIDLVPKTVETIAWLGFGFRL